MKNLKNFVLSVIKSYGQVFFSQNLLFSIIIILISFFDRYAGLYGLLSIIISNGIALTVGYNKYNTYKGIYGFNALLAGLGMGLYYQPSVELGIIVIIISVFIFFISIVLQGVLYKYGLPFLSIPFLLGIWLFILSSEQFTKLGLSERGIYTANEVYALGGHGLFKLYEWFNNIPLSSSVKAYFYSLGAIFFQYNLLAGILIGGGLLIYSRISFSLSLLGFYIAYFFYKITGADFEALSYNYIGFNYILTAIAIGGYYYIPRYNSYILVVLTLPIVVMITLAVNKLFNNFFLPVYSLPFNMTVIFTLYALKLREKDIFSLREPIVQHLNPETNLYYSLNQVNRFKGYQYIPLSLPFMGEWCVSQAHNGKYTHKNEWKHAWDFIINNYDKKQYKGEGNQLEDYFCYGKNVIAPADGEIVYIENNIEDNQIGKINIDKNWGNTIIIKHYEGLFSNVCHLKNNSIKVKVGDKVKKGEIIGHAGNSGRSPYPHLHFQIQGTPYIGSATIDYPLQNYMVKNDGKLSLIETGKPELNSFVFNPVNNELLEKAFSFMPGQKLKFEIQVTGHSSELKKLEGIHEWDIETDMYKNQYFHDIKNESFAYFFNNHAMNFFTDFSGKNNTFLHYFSMILYKTCLSFNKDIIIEDSIPVNYLFNKFTLFFQDFIAPFYLFLKVKYSINHFEVDDELYPSVLKFESTVTKSVFGRNKVVMKAIIYLNKSGIDHIELNVDNTNIYAKCINQ